MAAKNFERFSSRLTLCFPYLENSQGLWGSQMDEASDKIIIDCLIRTINRDIVSFSNLD